MNAFAEALCAEIWAMEPRALRALVAQVSAIPDAALEAAVAKRLEDGTAQAFDHLRNGGRDPADELDIRGGAAHIRLGGPLLKFVPSVFDAFDIEATGTEHTRELLAAALADERVERIVLDVDSPGGTVDGIDALAADVRNGRTTKTISTVAQDLMASAAYWVGAQAGDVVAGPTAAIGSIGVYSVVHDSSRAAEDAGVKVHVISSHDLKGAGVDGSPVTDEQVEDFQRLVDGYAALFIDAVAKGRGVSADAVRELATGQVWIGAGAMARGLVDGIDGDSAVTVPNVTPVLEPDEDEEEDEDGDDPEDEDEDDAEPEDDEEDEENSMVATTSTKADTKLAEQAAEIASLKASAKAVAKQRREDLIAKHRDRVTGENLEAVRDYGKFCKDDLAKLEAHIMALPVQTRPNEIGANTPPGDRPLRGEMTAYERKICRWFGFSHIDTVNRLGARGNSISTGNTLQLADGGFVPPEDFRGFARGEVKSLPAAEYGMPRATIDAPDVPVR